MTKRRKPKYSRGASRNGSRSIRVLDRIGHEGILPKSDVGKGLSGVGFAHKLKLSSSLEIDKLILGEMSLEEDQIAPYQYHDPRHITSIPHLSLDRWSLGFLNLGWKAHELKESLKEKCKEFDETTQKPLVCEIGEVIEIGGKTIIAEIDNARVSKIRSGLKDYFQKAGVAIPEMHAPHLMIGVADSFRWQHKISDIAGMVLSGRLIEVEEVDVYTSTYTELKRPDILPTNDPL
jgi:hypothetical protein